MICSYETCTKEKTIKYEQRLFIKTSLRQLGLNPKFNGFILLQKLIYYVYKEDIIMINLEEMYKKLSVKIGNISSKGIESSIRYSFYNINSKKLFENYEKIFGIEFDAKYFSIKNLISDFVDIL